MSARRTKKRGGTGARGRESIGGQVRTIVFLACCIMAMVGVWWFAPSTRHVWRVPAIHEEGVDGAHDCGQMNEWADGWYVAHLGTAAGDVIRSLRVGDVMQVDGVDVTIEGIAYGYKSQPACEIKERCGDDMTYFQTCVDELANFRVAYGKAVPHDGDWDEDAVQERFERASWIVRLMYLPFTPPGDDPAK